LRGGPHQDGTDSKERKRRYAEGAEACRNAHLRIHELAKWIDWCPTLVIQGGLFWKDGYYWIEDKPGLDVEINPDVAKAHLAPWQTR
jgi:L-alanine-DL-glutamate epimerase-like enolase superfamily enzyme